MPSSLLSVRGLKRLLVGPLDLDLAPGAAVCISGPSGSGKTLLLRAIADLDPHGGSVTLAGAAQQSVPGGPPEGGGGGGGGAPDGARGRGAGP
jgi:ABC-type transport system involved in cytochrome c biogenesis ATPase subunit